MQSALGDDRHARPPGAAPAFSALESQREHAIGLPSWQDGLAGYIAQRESEKEAV